MESLDTSVFPVMLAYDVDSASRVARRPHPGDSV